MYEINGKEYTCSVAVTVDIFNDKWKLSIIWHLLAEPRRFKEFKDLIGVSQKTLIIKLKELEEKNIIRREAFAEVPPRVVYSLSPAGERLRPVFKEMFNWGISYVKENGKVNSKNYSCETEVLKKISLKKTT